MTATGNRRPLAGPETDPEASSETDSEAGSEAGSDGRAPADGGSGRAGLAPREVGRLRRDPRRLAGPVPRGRCLEELAIAACLRRDVPALRRLLGDYAGWLAGFRDAEGRLPGEHAFATPRGTVVHGPEFAVLDPSWALTEPVPYEVALARGLRQLARTLVAGGYSHPWPTTLDPDGLTVILAGLTGHAVTRETVQTAADLAAEIAAASEIAATAAPAETGAVTPAVDLDGHRELRRAVARLTGELDHARAKLTWYAELLDSRERALARARHRADALTGSVFYRALRMLARPARRLIRR